jgi:Domain of unknown function (DUF5666)
MDKQIDKPQESVVPEQPTKATESKQPTNRHTLAVVAGVVIVAVLCFSVGWFGHVRAERNDVSLQPFAVHEGGMGERGFKDDLMNPTDGTAATRLSGVVTQVNGNTFTIAGNGTTKTITTNNSTTYNTGSNKVTVNDSVLVAGTDSNGTFTASSVHVLNSGN